MRLLYGQYPFGMTTTSVLRPRNRAARLGFGLWLAGVVIVLISTIVPLFGVGSGSTVGTAQVPLLASFAYGPLFLIGAIASAAGIVRKGQPKALALASLVFNTLSFLIAAVVVLTAVQLLFQR